MEHVGFTPGDVDLQSSKNGPSQSSTTIASVVLTSWLSKKEVKKTMEIKFPWQRIQQLA